MRYYPVICEIAIFTKELDPSVIAALIAALASSVVAIISLLSTVVSWIITAKQNKKNYKRDFDVKMYKEILPVIFELVNETKMGISRRREGGWDGFDKAIRAAENIYYGYIPFIQKEIRQSIDSVIDACRNVDANKIDSEFTELVDRITNNSDGLVKRK